MSNRLRFDQRRIHICMAPYTVKMGKNYYAVRRGRVPGIYNSWPDCQKQVHQFPGCMHKGFASIEEARSYLEGSGVATHLRTSTGDSQSPFKPQPRIVQALAKQPAKSTYGGMVQPNGLYGTASQATQPSYNLHPSNAAKAGVLHVLQFDGASRGNPGRAAAGALLSVFGGDKVGEVSHPLEGSESNNVAEYTALCCGLAAALEVGVTKIRAEGDSKLVVNQVNGNWQVNSDNIRSLYNRATRLKARFDEFSIQWIPRSENSRADHLANLALDTGGWQGMKTQQGYVKFDVNPTPRMSIGVMFLSAHTNTNSKRGRNDHGTVLNKRVRR